MKYQPAYLTDGWSFDMITNEEHPYLPWTCRLPSSRKYIVEEPKNHQVGIKKLTNVTFGIQKKDAQNRFTDLLSRESNIIFQHAEHHSLTLEFDHKRNQSIKRFRDFPLVIEY